VLASEVGRVDPATGACGAEPSPAAAAPAAGAAGAVLCNLGKLRPLAGPVTWRVRERFRDRLQLHFSIGQAF
jgi:hypothetical protein